MKSNKAITITKGMNGIKMVAINPTITMINVIKNIFPLVNEMINESIN